MIRNDLRGAKGRICVGINVARRKHGRDGYNGSRGDTQAQLGQMRRQGTWQVAFEKMGNRHLPGRVTVAVLCREWAAAVWFGDNE